MRGSRKLLLEEDVPYCTGGAWELKKGQSIRFITRHCIDFVAFDLHNFNDRFDQSRTRIHQSKLFVTKGDVLYSKDSNVMMTLTEDTWPWRHDIQCGPCSRKRLEMIFRGQVKPYARTEKGAIEPPRWKRLEDIPPRGCWENLENALKPWKVSKWVIPAPVNFFYDSQVDNKTGTIWHVPHQVDREYLVEMRAEMDLLVAGANDVDGPEPYRAQIYEA